MKYLFLFTLLLFKSQEIISQAKDSSTFQDNLLRLWGEVSEEIPEHRGKKGLILLKFNGDNSFQAYINSDFGPFVLQSGNWQLKNKIITFNVLKTERDTKDKKTYIKSRLLDKDMGVVEYILIKLDEKNLVLKKTNSENQLTFNHSKFNYFPKKTQQIKENSTTNIETIQNQLNACLNDSTGALLTYPGKILSKTLKSSDYSEESIKILWKILEKHKTNYYTYLIIGTTNRKEFIPPLKKLVDSFSDCRNDDLCYCINRALARLGDKESINRSIQYYLMDNRMEYEKAGRLNDIMYIKQYQLLDIILPLLKSNGFVPDFSKNRKNGVSVRRHAMDAINDLFLDFPKQDRGIGEYSDEQVQTTIELLKNPTKYKLNK
jgi:hypothetical protein